MYEHMYKNIYIYNHEYTSMPPVSTWIPPLLSFNPFSSIFPSEDNSIVLMPFATAFSIDVDVPSVCSSNREPLNSSCLDLYLTRMILMTILMTMLMIVIMVIVVMVVVVLWVVLLLLVNSVNLWLCL